MFAKTISSCIKANVLFPQRFRYPERKEREARRQICSTEERTPQNQSWVRWEGVRGGVVDAGGRVVPACGLCWPSGAYISVKPSPRSLSMGDSLPGS